MIKELIERLELTPEEIQRAIWKSEYKATDWERFRQIGLKKYESAIAQAQLNKVLKDPDLYYLDRNVRIKEVDDFYAAFIPLREAIKNKEVKE